MSHLDEEEGDGVLQGVIPVEDTAHLLGVQLGSGWRYHHGAQDLPFKTILWDWYAVDSQPDTSLTASLKFTMLPREECGLMARVSPTG